LTLLPCLFSERSHRFSVGVTRCDSRGEATNGSCQLWHNDDRSLSISVEVIQRALSIRIAGYDLDPVR